MLALLSAIILGTIQADPVAANWEPLFTATDGSTGFYFDASTLAPYAQYKTGWFLKRDADGTEVSFYARAYCSARMISTPNIITRTPGEETKRETFQGDMPVEPNTYNELMFDLLCD